MALVLKCLCVCASACLTLHAVWLNFSLFYLLSFLYFVLCLSVSLSAMPEGVLSVSLSAVSTQEGPSPARTQTTFTLFPALTRALLMAQVGTTTSSTVTSNTSSTITTSSRQQQTLQVTWVTPHL